jgi:hypothetical protein
MTNFAETPDPAAGSPETNVDTPTEGAPSDNTTLVDVLATWNDRGFGGQLIGLDGGRIECVECGTVSSAGQFDVVEWRRLEGASDPDDMVKAIAARCPACGVGGNLVLGYGVNASDVDGQISAAIGATGDTSVQTPDQP